MNKVEQRITQLTQELQTGDMKTLYECYYNRKEDSNVDIYILHYTPKRTINRFWKLKHELDRLLELK